MKSPAPQPAPLRPGQRAAKPAKAKPLTPRQRAALALLDKPGAYAYTHAGSAFVSGNGPSTEIDLPDLDSLAERGLVNRRWWGSRYGITAAGRAALRAGSRGGGRVKRR